MAGKIRADERSRSDVPIMRFYHILWSGRWPYYRGGNWGQSTNRGQTTFFHSFLFIKRGLTPLVSIKRGLTPLVAK